MTTHSTTRRVGALVSLAATTLVSSACGNLTVENPNNPNQNAVLASPNATNIDAMTTGLLRVTRVNVSGMVEWLGAFGREGYPMSVTGVALPGSVRDALNGNGSPGSSLWSDPYRNIRSENILLSVVGSVPTFTAAQISATKGFTETLKAYDFLQVVLTRTRFGAPVDVGTDPTAALGPFVSQDSVYHYIVALLEAGKADLAAGGTAFPFPLTSGLAGFNTPPTFLKVNRALRARVAVYLNDWPTAIQALSESFVSTSSPLSLGAYHVFSNNSGDAPNPDFNPTLFYANPRLVTNAQLRADGSLDLRVQTKLQTVPAFTVQGITSSLQFTLYSSAASPIPWIRNEELILLRAEANLGLGNTAAAIADVNYIRTTAGGLPPLPVPFTGDLLGEILYNKRYSLLWEFGHTWIDMLHYGRLLNIPVGTADPRLFDAMPIPVSECQPRTPQPTGCGIVTGFLPATTP